MKKKSIYVIGILLSCFLVIGLASMPQIKASSVYDLLSQIGKKHKIETYDEEETVALVNNVIVTKESLEKAYDLEVAFYEVNTALFGFDGEAPTKEAVLKSLVEREALVQEAERIGLGATEEQIKEHFAQVDEQLNSAESEEATMIMNAYLEGLGMDYTTYREVYEKPLAKRELTIENLYMYVMEKQIGAVTWETYKENVLQKATIQYIKK